MASNGFSTEIKKTHSDYIIAVLLVTLDSMERAYDYKSKVFLMILEILKKLVKKFLLMLLKS